MQILKTTDCYFLGKLSKRDPAFYDIAETKNNDNLPIPYAYRCLGHLPSFPFQCQTNS